MRLLYLFAGVFLGVVAYAAGPREELFRYEVKWPSGLGLGEAQMRASRDGGHWILEFEIEASVPGFRVLDRYKSVVDDNFCSQSFEKSFEHGARKGKETTVYANGRAVRTTANGGGKSEFDVPACPRDALAYLFHVRQEVARGRVPAAQKVFFGGGYEIRIKSNGAQSVKVSEAPMEADQLKVTIPTSNGKVEIDLFLARDEARTPVVVRAPFAMGNFSMEWVR
ncbi:MAG TPA: DUF3108 domain-containing protein [Bryobacteraceae bacterium]|nr:DUF3108 domain-containing protein [Bryobacteraceae bacterium]